MSISVAEADCNLLPTTEVIAIDRPTTSGRLENHVPPSPVRTRAGSKFAALTLAAGLLASPIALDAPPAEAITKKCSAKMSVSQPRQYSNTYVNVSKVGSKGKTTWKCSTSFKPKKKR